MRAALAPPGPHGPATDRTSTAAPARLALALVLAACTPPPEGSPTHPSPSPGPTTPAAPAQPTRTANNDARGAGVQPDYDGEARLLREQVLPRLPGPLAPDRRAACTAMLDAVTAFYADIERDAAPRAQLLADLQTSRTADLATCERETSVRAASCVTLRLADRDAEFPWLLDQCSRAFPE